MLYTPLWYRDSIVTLSIPATTEEELTNTHEVTTLPERDMGGDSGRSCGEVLSVVPPVFGYLSFSTSSIRNSIEDYSNGLYQCIV